MIPSDNNPTGQKLNSYSLEFATIRGQVITYWKSKLLERENLKIIVRETTLIDSLPIIFDGLVEALTPDYPREFAASGTKLGQSHGVERAYRSSYQPSDIAEELIIFRDSIFFIAAKNKIEINKTQARIIIKSIDLIIIQSLKSFSEKHKRDVNGECLEIISELREPLDLAIAHVDLIESKNTSIATAQITNEISKNLREIRKTIYGSLKDKPLRSRKKLRLRIESLDIEQVAFEVISEMELTHSVFVYSTHRFRGFWCKNSLKIAIQSMLYNAQKHSLRNEPITINVSKFEQRLLFSVHNEGLPILPNIRKKIIDDLENSGEANICDWANGLQIIQTVAESHGGTIIFDSEKNRGTTFSMNLPVDSRQYISDNNDNLNLER